jgi:thiamine-monophosphate kinase
LIKEGALAAKYASSMIDNSDGLARCIIEICKASKVGARIYMNAIPIVRGATMNDALHGGEDYNLVLTASKQKAKLIKGAVIIGEVVKGKSINIIDNNGKASKLTGKGFEHF